MRAILCAAGSGSRWNNYTGRRKHYARIEEKGVLDKIIDRLQYRGVTDIFIVANTDYPYHRDGVNTLLVRPGMTHIESRLETQGLWDKAGRTLLILGDAHLTDMTMDLFCAPIPGWHQVGRLKPSVSTGKPGAEMFGWAFDPSDHARFVQVLTDLRALELAGIKIPNDWAVYSHWCGRRFNTPPDDIRNWGNHLEVDDDGTDDFDFPDDYERFMSLRRKSSRIPHFADFESAPYMNFTASMDLDGARRHRKNWEHFAISQAYWQRFGPKEERKALGFGVGKERITSWLASRGVDVTATDKADAGVWLDRQHSKGLEDTYFKDIVDRDTFERYAEFYPHDMNDELPPSWKGRFDFTWSMSSFEHLGSREAGLNFFARQMQALKPGGVAAHITELTLNGEPLDVPGLAVFSLGDLECLRVMLENKGDRLWPIDVSLGERSEDQLVDATPDGSAPIHLKLKRYDSVFTSVLLLAMRGYRG